MPGETALQERPGTYAWDEGMAAISRQRFFNMSYDEFLAATVPCSLRVRSNGWAALAETEANLAYIPWNDDVGDPTPLQQDKMLQIAAELRHADQEAARVQARGSAERVRVTARDDAVPEIFRGALPLGLALGGIVFL